MNSRPLCKATVIWCLTGLVLLLGLGCGARENDAAGVNEIGETNTGKFSFFLTSVKALQELSGSADGFGGNLTFGETGPGAGLRGADKICADIAEKSMPGSSSKKWRAFLSAAKDENGQQVDAIDRIGDGPWYDRLGRLFALTKADLLYTRPHGADAVIRNDFPNEDGVPNHRPDPTQAEVDNHDVVTGSDAQGRLYSATSTCNDWTSADGATGGRPRVGHSWPRSGNGMIPTGMDGGFPFGGMGMMPQLTAGDGGTCACVDESGACHVGMSAAHCGTGGKACVECATGQTCLNGVCGSSDGGVTNPFGGGTNPFGGGMNPFGGGANPFGDGGMTGFPFGNGAFPFDMGEGGMPGFGGMESMDHWISVFDEAGCAPGVHISERGAPLYGQENNIGSGGGYGGYYCFALTP